MIRLAQTMIDRLVTFAGGQDGFSDDEKAEILAAADAADKRWDDQVAAARARLEER